jgi:hypothetical protein
MKKFTEAKMIEKINEVFPEAKAVPLSEFYNDPEMEGIWFQGSEYCDVVPGEYGPEAMYNDYDERWADTAGVNPKFDEFIREHGWMCQPYDPGTLMAVKEY